MATIRSVSGRVRMALALPVVLALLAAAFAIGALPASAANQAVTIQNFAFNPGTVNVSVGDTVTWTNQDSAEHTVTSDTGAFGSSALGQGQSFSFTFTQAGTFAYHCAIHPTMTGTVVVAAASSGATQTPGTGATAQPPATGSGTSGGGTDWAPLGALAGGLAIAFAAGAIVFVRARSR